MRPTRTFTLLAGLALLVLAAGTTSACPGSGTKVSGTFDASGHFVLSGAWDKDGAPVANAQGMVLESFTTAENLVIPASSLAGKQVCLWGELDADHKTMSVAGYKECAPGACDAKSAAACGGAKEASASTGAGCCPAGKTAQASSAGAGCGSKAAQASSAGAGCGSMAAQASSAGAGCGAKAATAGSSCGAKAASAGACGTDAASAKANKMVKAEDAPKADAAVATYVYDVSGMTCGGCASKVETAVTKLALPNVTACTVDLEKNQATVTATGEIDREAVAKAITAAGFPATFVTPETAKG